MANQFYSFNRIFDIDVTAKSKLVYLYLCRMANSHAQCFPSRKTIAVACGFSVESVKRAMRELAENGLVCKEERFANTGRQTSNLYSIMRQEGGYFYADNDIFEHDISTGAKLVFLYICRCGENRVSFPAYSRIARMCSLSVSHVLDCVRELENAGLLQKNAQYRGNGGRANNLYVQQETVPAGCQNGNCDDRVNSSKCTTTTSKRLFPRRMAKRAVRQIDLALVSIVTHLDILFISCSPPHAAGVPP